MLYRSAIITKDESVSKLPTSVQLMPQLIDKIYLFQKKCSFACVCAFFVVTSRTPTLPQAIPPRNYVREMRPILQTLAHYFENTAVPTH